jgi:hypothetical protein
MLDLEFNFSYIILYPLIRTQKQMEHSPLKEEILGGMLVTKQSESSPALDAQKKPPHHHSTGKKSSRRK